MNRVHASSSPAWLQGVIAPMFTPVDRTLRIEESGVKAFVEWLASRGCVRTVFARSGMGKMFTFTVAEACRLGEVVREAINGRMGMVLGAGGEWLHRDRGERPDPGRYVEQAIEITLHAQRIGADGAVHVLPAALVPTGEETVEETIFRYYETVHNATNLPIILYQPSGLPPEYHMTPALLRRLLTLPRIAGMKLSTAVDSTFCALAEMVQGTPFALICGHEGYYLEGLEQGAVGVIGQGCMVYPEILHAVEVAFQRGDMPAAQRAREDVWRALKVSGGLDSAVALKQYLTRKGVNIPPYDRSGTDPYPPEVIDRVERELDSLLSNYGS